VVHVPGTGTMRRYQVPVPSYKHRINAGFILASIVGRNGNKQCAPHTHVLSHFLVFVRRDASCPVSLVRYVKLRLHSYDFLSLAAD
jgi:hypothetical protein